MSDTEMVDWDLAVRTAGRLAGSGPRITTEQADEVVADLRRCAVLAREHVQRVAEIDSSAHESPVVVLNRARWAQANAHNMRTIIAPLEQKIRTNRDESALDSVGPKVTGVQTGILLAFLAGKVLGQFDPFWVDDKDKPTGRLLLVAPNVVHVERELSVVPKDFRLWVCLHEETHRAQFVAAPWLRAYLSDEIEAFIAATDVDPATWLSRVNEGVRSLLDSVTTGEEPQSLVTLMQSPQQKVIIERVTAVMSLLEGHADAMMDRVGPQVIPTVATIRRKFQRRRGGTGAIDRIVRKFFGLDAKMRQYRDGAVFVNAVIDDVGVSGFNRVWESQSNLPTLQEITDPSAWVRRLFDSGH